MRDVDRSMRHGQRDRHGRRKLLPLGTEMSRSSSAWETDSLASGKLSPNYKLGSLFPFSLLHMLLSHVQSQQTGPL